MGGLFKMPIYLFEKNGKIREIFFKMNDEKRFFDENGEEWTRIFVRPQVAIDTAWDANSATDFVTKTGKKSGTMNDIWEKSKELSEAREKKLGVDPVKQQHYEDYKKNHRGVEHPDVKKQKLKEKLKNTMFELSE